MKLSFIAIRNLGIEAIGEGGDVISLLDINLFEMMRAMRLSDSHIEL